MKKFYTNVQCVGDYILFRGIVDGKRRQEKIGYRPTLFVPTNKDSKYKTLDGRLVGSVRPGSIRATRDFVKNYAFNLFKIPKNNL